MFPNRIRSTLVGGVPADEKGVVKSSSRCRKLGGEQERRDTKPNSGEKKKYPPKTHRHEDWWLRIRRGTAGGGAGAFGSAKDANGDGGDAMAACCTSAALGGDGEDYGGTR